MTRTKREDILNILELRRCGYEFLRNIFYVEPNLEFISQIINKDIIRSFPLIEVAPSINQGVYLIVIELKNNEGHLNSYYEKLHWDYTKMFVGPNYLLAPPWESAYFNDGRLIFQEQTFSVRERYLKYNFLPKNYLYDPDDHIGCELDFMYRLSNICIRNFEDNNETEVIIHLKEQQEFICEHLIKWIDMFVDNVLQLSETRFYRGFALVLKGFIAADKQIMGELLLEYGVNI